MTTSHDDRPGRLARSIGWPSAATVEAQIVGKYIDVSYPNGEGAAGWVENVQVEDDTLWVCFDWGWAQRVDGDTLLIEVDPPDPPDYDRRG